MRVGAWLHRAGVVLALLPAVIGGASASQDWPIPPCDSQVHPTYAEIDEPPTVAVWLGDDQREVWSPPACTGWAAQRFASMIAVAGRFRVVGGVATLAERVGAISTATQIRYWSVSRQTWRPLFVEAHALRSPNPETERGDFAEDELRPGAHLYFIQDENNPTGPVAYRMTVHERRLDRLVVGVTNVSAARLFLIPIFAEGKQEAISFLTHEGDDVWRFYGLTRLGDSPDPDAQDHAPSLINRAVALYRHLAGIPTDAEPPAAP